MQNWAATWTMPTGVQLVSGWNATVSQQGQTVTATGPSWAPTLPAGASVTIGFQANGSTAVAPSGYRLGSTVCTV